MSIAQAPVSDMLVTVKSREIQRAMLAEMRGERAAATRHFLAATHLELVLASDYADAGQNDLAARSRISAASCLWRSGQPDQGRALLEALVRDEPTQGTAVQQVIADLEANYPQLAS